MVSNNKDYMKEYMQKYNAMKRAQGIKTCECGASINLAGEYIHKNTAKHKKYLAITQMYEEKFKALKETQEKVEVTALQ